MTDKEKYNILSSFLIRLHTAGWSGNTKQFAELMERLAAYSYARTNSNYGDTEEEEEGRYERTLLILEK